MSFRDELNALHKNNTDFENVYENRSVQISQSYYDYFGMRVCELLKEKMRESVKNKQVRWENGIFKKKYYYSATVSFSIEHSKTTYAPNSHSTEGYYINEFPRVYDPYECLDTGGSVFLLSSWYSSDIYKALCAFVHCMQQESTEFSEIGVHTFPYYASEGYGDGAGYKIGSMVRHHERLYSHVGGRITPIGTDHGQLFEGKGYINFAGELINGIKQRDSDIRGRGITISLTAKINCTQIGQII